MKRLARRALVLSALLAAPALAQDAMNTVTRVEVKSGVVEISGTQKPSFSTFPMSDPPRLVVDISQAVFSGVPEAMDVKSGHVVAIKTASYGSNASAIARVVIGFDREVEPDIQTVGNKLVVRATLAPASPAVAAAPPPAQDSAPVAAPTAASPSAPAVDSAAVAEKQRQDAAAAQAAADEKRRQDALAAAAVAEKQRQDAQAAAAAAAEKQRLDEAAAVAAAEEKRRREDAAAAAAAEEKRRQQAAAAAAAEEQRQKQEAALARTQQEKDAAAAQAAAAEQQRQKEAALAAAAAENQRKQQAEADAAAAEEKRRQDAALASAAEEKQRTAAAQAAEQRRVEDTRAAAAARTRVNQDQLAVAARPAAPAAETPVSIEGNGSSGGTEANSKRKSLTFVGFDEKGPRVYVRTNGPVRYSVTTGAKNTVVVELDNTAIPVHNNARPLDTAFFAGPVLRIQPGRGPKNSVRVAITLRDAVAFQAHQDGNEVSVQFRAP